MGALNKRKCGAVKVRHLMNWKFGVGLLLMTVAQIARADSAVQQAQEALKEQGFYFGQISGEKNADTTAAIRRFQIRNGLPITGELNQETLQALTSNSTASVQTATPAPQGNERRVEPQQHDEVRDEAPPPTTAISPAPPHAREIYPAPQLEPSGDIFGDSPYATAPPPLQRQVILGAESTLRRRGLYRGPADGAFGPELQSALREYQSRIGITVSGHLDMDTLASLGLLPGRRGRHLPRDLPEPPVHGEWIH
jgi:peptidoglycan hydrolase-like protein with peptidoglycan-binding domain